MKKKPKVLNLHLFTFSDAIIRDIPYIHPLCGQFNDDTLNSKWETYWNSINYKQYNCITEYFDNYFDNFDTLLPYMYLLRVMVLLDFCELHGYKLEDIKYE